MWIFRNVFSPFSINEHLGCFWLFGFLPLLPQPCDQTTMCTWDTSSGRDVELLWRWVWAFYIFCRHFQITLYKHHDEFHTYQQWKVFIAISIVWFAFLWWLMRLSLLSYIYWPSAVPLRWTICSELLFIFSFGWFAFCLLFVWIH